MLTNRWQYDSIFLILLGLLFGSMSTLADTIEATRTFEGHTNSVEAVAVSNDGKQILSGSYDNTVKLWNIENGDTIHTFQGHSEFVMSVAFSVKNDIVLSASADNTLKRWDIETGEVIDTFQENVGKRIGWIYSVAFSPKQNHAFLSGSYDNELKLWNSKTGSQINTFAGHQDWIYLITSSPNGNQVASVSEDGTITVWDAQTGKETRSFKETGIWTTAFSHDGNQIVIGNDQGTLKLLDIATGNEVRSFQGHNGRVYSVVFSPDDKQILSGGHDGTIKVWDTETGEDIHTLKGHKDIVSSLAFSPDGSQVISGSYDNTVKLWLLLGILPPCTTDCTTELAIKGLETGTYHNGDQIMMSIVETGNRSKSVDLWFAINIPENELWFKSSTSSELYTLAHQAFKTSVSNSERIHQLPDFEVLPWMIGGEYTIYAVYAQENQNPVPVSMGGNGKAVWRSNLATGKMTLVIDGE